MTARARGGIALLIVAVALWWVFTRGDDRAVEGDVDFSEFTVRGTTYTDTSKEG